MKDRKKEQSLLQAGWTTNGKMWFPPASWNHGPVFLGRAWQMYQTRKEKK